MHGSSTCIRANFAIVACPPVIAQRILFTPRLPIYREIIMQKSFMGSIIKIVCTYKQAFWRSNGFSGEVVCDCLDINTQPVFNVYDFSKEQADGTIAPALVSFINGEPARVWSERSDQDRKAVVLKQLQSWFGDEALSPTYYLEKNWVVDEWSRGCPTNNLHTGALKAAGHTLRAQNGRIHWASTETSTQHMGFMEGAVLAGYRAATEVLDSAAKPTAYKPINPSLKAVVKGRIGGYWCDNFKLFLLMFFFLFASCYFFWSLEQSHQDHYRNQALSLVRSFF